MEVDCLGTPVVNAPPPSAMRPAEPAGSAAAVQAQHQALSSLLASLQAATQKGSNRCGPHPPYNAVPALNPKHYMTVSFPCMPALSRAAFASSSNND